MIQQDEEVLSSDLSPCKNLAIRMRLSEKRILNNVIEYLQLRIKN